ANLSLRSEVRKFSRSSRWLISVSSVDSGRNGRGHGAAALDIVQQAAAAGVDGPGHGQAQDVEGEEGPQRRQRRSGQFDGGAVGLGDEEPAIAADGAGEGD